MNPSQALLSKVDELNKRYQMSLPACLSCSGTIIVTENLDNIPTRCYDCANPPQDIMCIDCGDTVVAVGKINDYNDDSLLCGYCSSVPKCVECNDGLEEGTEDVLCDGCYENISSNYENETSWILQCEISHPERFYLNSTICEECKSMMMVSSLGGK